MSVKTPRYAHVRHLPSRTVPEARAAVADRLADEGFGVLTEIDVQATLQKKPRRPGLRPPEPLREAARQAGARPATSIVALALS